MVKADAVVVDPSTYTVERLFGRITFDSSHDGETITITSSYVPRTLVGYLLNAALDDRWETEESTCLGDAAEDHTPTVQRIRITFTSIDAANAGDVDVQTVFTGNTETVLEFDPFGNGEQITRVLSILPSRATNTNAPAGIQKIDYGSIGAGALVGYGDV